MSTRLPMPLSLDVERQDARPYFLWDTSLTIAEFQRRLESQDIKTRIYWIARLMRDARYKDVWKFVRLRDLLEMWDSLRPRLGRERARWEFLINGWRRDGLIP